MSKIDWSKMITPETRAAAERKAKYEALREYRWQVETGGIEVGGVGTVPTSRDSQSQINNAISSLSLGAISAPVAWSMGGAWVDLTAEQITVVGAAVATHVQACFDAQRAVEGQMDALDDLTDFTLKSAFDAAYAGRMALLVENN